MRVREIIGSLAILAAGLGSQASAQDCSTLKLLNSIDLVRPNPVRALIPVSINGIPKLFLLDTGGDISGIGDEVAKELHLTEREAGMKMLDLYGHASNKYVSIDKFTVGRLTGQDVHLAVEPNPNFGQGTRYVGIFAPDLMGRYDVEIDFGTYKMNYFSTDHCPGKVVYWPHNALAMLPFTFHKRHIRFKVQVDGKEMTAEMDTGAPNTSMRNDAARRLFDLTPETPGNIPLNQQGMAAAYGRVFSTLDFEGVAVTNPHVIIMPDLVGSKDPNNARQTGNLTRMMDDPDDPPDMLIGMDILRKLHLYIAFDESHIFISEASAPPKAVLPPTGTPTASATQQ